MQPPRPVRLLLRPGPRAQRAARDARREAEGRRAADAQRDAKTAALV